MSEIQPWKLPAGILVGALAIYGGVTIYDDRPCGMRGSCTDAEALINYTEVDSDPVWQSFSVDTDNSTTQVYNVTRKNVGELTLQNVVEYYEDEFSKPRISTIKVQTSAKSKPTDITVTGVRGSASEHSIFVVDTDTPMPDDLLVAGVTTYPMRTQTVSVVKAPQFADALGITHDSGLVPNETAQDVLYTELCQAIVEVEPARKEDDIPLLIQLSQETECNSEGAAMVAAARKEPYSAYAKDIEASQGQTAVTYNDREFLIDLAPVTPAEYADLEKLF